jgi:hypothetical protein
VKSSTFYRRQPATQLSVWSMRADRRAPSGGDTVVRSSSTLFRASQLASRPPTMFLSRSNGFVPRVSSDNTVNSKRTTGIVEIAHALHGGRNGWSACAFRRQPSSCIRCGPLTVRSRPSFRHSCARLGALPPVAGGDRRGFVGRPEAALGRQLQQPTH